MTFTKEQLIAQAQKNIEVLRGAVEKIPGGSDAAVIHLRLAEITLASLEAEPVSFDELRDAVAEVSGGPAMEWSDTYKGHQPVPFINFNSLARIVDKFRAAPPAPVSVPDFGALTKCIVQRLVDYGTTDDEAIASAEEFVYNTCRAAMFQGKAGPVSQRLGGPSGVHAKNEPHKLIGAGDIPYGGAGDDLTSRGNGGGK